MPSTDRRTMLASLAGAATTALAGCAALQDGSPPAGSLRFRNDHDLPHSIRLAVTDVGSTVGDEPDAVTGDVTVPPSQGNLTTAASLEPGAKETYESVFTESVWYRVRFRVDGETPPESASVTLFNPAPDGEDRGRVLTARVSESGSFRWGVGSTRDLGSFG